MIWKLLRCCSFLNHFNPLMILDIFIISTLPFYKHKSVTWYIIFLFKLFMWFIWLDINYFLNIIINECKIVLCTKFNFRSLNIIDEPKNYLKNVQLILAYRFKIDFYLCIFFFSIYHQKLAVLDSEDGTRPHSTNYIHGFKLYKKFWLHFLLSKKKL